MMRAVMVKRMVRPCEMYRNGPRVRAKTMRRKIMRPPRWALLVQFDWTYENSASVARIMMSDETAPPRATADHRIAGA
jgi:hypothetical protein